MKCSTANVVELENQILDSGYVKFQQWYSKKKVPNHKL